MTFDINIIPYIAISVLFLVILFFLNQKKNATQTKKINELTRDIEKLKKNVFDKDISLASYENVKQTSLIVSEIKKREILEEEITRLKKTIQDTKVIAQDASMVKTDFLTNIRHEIRTPMNSILVFSEMLKKSITDKQLNTYAKNIFHSGHNLLNLMNNVIELSEIEAGSFEVETSAVDIKNFMDLELEKHQNAAKKKSLELSLYISDSMPESLMIDKKKVEEIVHNLISNAIRFTKYGTVKIILEQDAFNKTNNTADISISIEDTGIGILKENQEKIFKIFESRHSSNTIEYQGTGLGLSINRKLARLMDGDIEVRSEQAIGSTFTLLLNNVEIVLASLAEGINEDSIDFTLLKKSKIVVLDDLESSLEIISSSLKNTHVECHTFESAREAIDYLRHNTVDLLLVDVEILTMDDGAVSKVLNKIISNPVVSLVSTRLREIHFPQLGVQPIAHLKKPFHKVDLFRTLLKVLNSQKVELQKDGDVTIKENVRVLSFTKNQKASLEYFQSQPKEIDAMLYDALTTNDITTIEKLAKLILIHSQKCKFFSLEHFSKVLLDKIDNFDIEEIDKMLNEYKFKSKEFRRS